MATAGGVPDPDELFTLRNRFWLGNFQMAIAEGNNLARLSEPLKLERDEFVYRSYLGLGQYTLVLAQIKDDAPAPLQAVKLLAKYMADPEGAKAECLAQCDAWCGDGRTTIEEPTVALMCSLIYEKEEMTDKMFQAIQAQKTMEHLALWAQYCLKIHRLDLAAEHLKKLQQLDEDATLTQLVSAWVHLAQGGDKIKEAALAYEELIDKFDASVSLLNGLAACHMHLKEWDDAEKVLLQALGKGDNAETILNLVAVYVHLGKPQDVLDRYLTQLKTQFPNHPQVQRINRLEATFDRVAERMRLKEEGDAPDAGADDD